MQHFFRRCKNIFVVFCCLEKVLSWLCLFKGTCQGVASLPACQWQLSVAIVQFQIPQCWTLLEACLWLESNSPYLLFHEKWSWHFCPRLFGLWCKMAKWNQLSKITSGGQGRRVFGTETDDVEHNTSQSWSILEALLLKFMKVVVFALSPG